MLFSSLTFIFLFLPVVLAVYYLAPLKIRNLLLLLASLIFYAWGEPVYVVLMILSILLNYCCGREIAANAEDERKAHRGMIFTVVVNLALLFFFKYYGFFLELVNSVTSAELTYRELALPVGISFYTFQGISYVVDVYRGKAKAQRSLLNFALYIALFPQLIAGPIGRYEDIEPQLAQRKVSARKLGQGAMLFLIGLAKKAVLADTFKTVFEEISAISASNLSVPMAWIGCITYAFEIYYDFSGYSDMAIGLSRMFGFELKKNFDHPYVSRSVTEFWRRWHISLSTWFREYVYIPLGGNHCSGGRHILNLLIVWTLTGMWHGAAWNFIVWGFYYGVLMVMEKYVWGSEVDRLPSPLRRIYTAVCVLVGWVFFFSPSLGAAFRYLGAMVGTGGGLLDAGAGYVFFSHWLYYLLAVVGMSAFGGRLLRRIISLPESETARTVVAGILFFGMMAISVAFLVTETYQPFLYFRF